jgi:hypothetical protein
MQTRSLAAALVLALAGCSSGADTGSGDFGAISVIGTPVLIGLKIPACAATIAIAAPVTAFAMLARPNSQLGSVNRDFDYNVQIRDELDDGIYQNCGPPYVVTR